MAAFMEGRKVCQLRYEVVADQAFEARSAHVEGRIGSTSLDLVIRRDRKRRWKINGIEYSKAEGCIDLDLGFTPSTNLLAIRRLGLSVNDHGESNAVYLEIPSTKIRVLPQRYRRVSQLEYEYESPTHGYRGTLEVSRLGAIKRYPGVFEMEAGK